MRTRYVAAFALLLVTGRGLVACGSRTGLLAPEPPDAAMDAALDTAFDVVPDRPHDVVPDRFDAIAEDAAQEPDVFVEEDALPPIDVGHDNGPLPGCFDAGATQIYVVSEQNELFSFYPPTLAFTDIGAINCPAPMNSTPFSMGVNRIGIAEVVFSDGTLFRLSTLNAACMGTSFVPMQHGFTTFGMSFVGDPVDGGDTLYVAGTNPGQGLATIDTNTYILSPVAQFQPMDLVRAELTGTGGGALYAFYQPNGGVDSAIIQVDPMTGQEIATSPLPGVSQGNAWAFAFWGGDFYLFTAPDNTTSQVTRFRPSDGSITVVATLPFMTLIVGAGVSTCAPQG